MEACTIDQSTVIRGTKGSSPGRSLHASRAFQAGELITEFTKPILALPNGLSSKIVCNHCLVHNVPTRACTGCKAAVYCSPSCQKANWSLIHKSECKAFRNVRASVDKDWLPTPVRALLQVLLRWEEQDVRIAFGNLEGNVDKFKKNKDVWKDIGLQAYGGMTYAGRPETDAELNLARDILCKVQTNSFDRTDVDTGQAGIFLDPTLAMVNHSCVSNANVSFYKRKAYLRAEAPIKEGDEITISYIDYTKPKTYRQLGLTLYHFECVCPRCKDDLTVYEVCRQSQVIPLNAFSLHPDLETLCNPKLNLPTSMTTVKALKSRIDKMYSECQMPKTSDTKTRLAHLRHQWEQCQPLIEARMWAIEPLGLMIEHAIMYYTELGSFAHALSISCFAALDCDPYKYPAPFKQWRLKGVLVIAKTLTNTARPSAMEELAKKSHPNVMVVLKQADQVSICQALTMMVVKYGPMAHSAEWEITDLARSMLKDIESLPGREKESSMLRAWAETGDQEGTAYFKDQILQPIQDLAGFAEEILISDFSQSGGLMLARN